jgi:hypothetical protein
VWEIVLAYTTPQTCWGLHLQTLQISVEPNHQITYLLIINRDKLQLNFCNLTYINFTKEIIHKKKHKPPLIWPLLVRQVYYCNHNRWDHSADRARLKPLRKTYRLSSSRKTNKPQYPFKTKIALFSMYDGESPSI